MKAPQKEAEKAAEKAPSSLWVRVNSSSNLSAGSHSVGPFITKIGDHQSKSISREWKEFDGTWASKLKSSALAKNFEFSTKKP